MRMKLAITAAVIMCVPALAQQSGNNAARDQTRPGISNTQATSNPGQSPASRSTPDGGPSAKAGAPSPAIPAINEVSVHQLSTGQVEEIQRALNQKGDNAGRVDGKWGPETESAIMAFQKSMSIASTHGNVDATTLTALGLKPADFGLTMHDTIGRTSSRTDGNIGGQNR